MNVMLLRRQLYASERFREGDLVAYEPGAAYDDLCASDLSLVLPELYGKMVIEVAKERAHLGAVDALRDADLQRYYNKADALETQRLAVTQRTGEDSAESRQLELLSSKHDSVTYRVKNGEVDERLIRTIMEKLMPQQVPPPDSVSKSQ